MHLRASSWIGPCDPGTKLAWVAVDHWILPASSLRASLASDQSSRSAAALRRKSPAERWMRQDCLLAQEAGERKVWWIFDRKRDGRRDTLRKIQIGRIRTLERLGLAEPAGLGRLRS